MELIELRDPEDTRVYLLDAIFLQRAAKPTATTLKTALELALQIVFEGQPLLPTGVLADFHTIAFGAETNKFTKDHPSYPGWPAHLLSQYEDHVLGKLHSDWSFERASDGLRRYQGLDRLKGLGYVLKQFRERSKLGGVEISPAVLRSLLQSNASDALAKTAERLAERGPHVLLKDHYQALIAAARRTPDLLGAEDIQAIEQRTALADMGEYVAHRQIVQTAARIERALPGRPVKALAGRKEVPTHVHDEDQYPIGGYSSLSNRGSIESLLHSQLAYMEPDERPDLFDVKFIRDELFYYSRDENQFLRRRRVFVFVLEPSLIDARFKDAELPCQRIVMVQSLVVALIRKLAEWLTADAIRFEIVLPTAKNRPALTDEAKLFGSLLLQMREAGTVTISAGSSLDIAEYTKSMTAVAQVHLLMLGTKPDQPEIENVVVSTLAVDGPTPVLTDGHGEAVAITAEDAFDHWVEVAIHLLQLWV